MKLCTLAGQWWVTATGGRVWTTGSWIAMGRLNSLSMILPQLWLLGHRCRLERFLGKFCRNIPEWNWMARCTGFRSRSGGFCAFRPEDSGVLDT